MYELKAFCSREIHMTQYEVFFKGVENIMRKGQKENMLLKCNHFLLLPQCFQKVSFSESPKVRICPVQKQEAFVDSVDQDQTAPNLQSDF